MIRDGYRPTGPPVDLTVVRPPQEPTAAVSGGSSVSDGRCVTCRHWRNDPDDEVWGNNESWRRCHMASTGWREGPPAGSRAMATCTDEGVWGELFTAPDFGCNQYEAKD